MGTGVPNSGMAKRQHNTTGHCDDLPRAECGLSLRSPWASSGTNLTSTVSSADSSGEINGVGGRYGLRARLIVHHRKTQPTQVRATDPSHFITPPGIECHPVMSQRACVRIGDPPRMVRFSYCAVLFTWQR